MVPSVGGNRDETRQVIGLMRAELKLELLTAGCALHRKKLSKADLLIHRQ